MMDKEPNINIKDYSVPSGIYITSLAKMWLKDWAIALLLPVVMVGFMAFKHIGFLFVALMMIFILFPMLLTYIYIWHGLKAESRYTILEKKIAINDEGIDLDFGDWKRQLHWDNFSGYVITSTGINFIFLSSKYLFFYIPYSAFGSRDDLRNFMLFLKDKGLKKMK